MSQGELPDFELDDSYTIPFTEEQHNFDDVDFSDDEESFKEGETTLPDESDSDNTYNDEYSENEYSENEDT